MSFEMLNREEFDPEDLEDLEIQKLLSLGALTWEDYASIPKMEFLFDDFLPWGYAVVLSSEPGAGKSRLALALAREAIRKGVRVVYLDGTNPLPYIASNLRSFGLVDKLAKKLFYASRCKKEFYVSPKDETWNKLKSILKTVDRSFVVIDALGPVSRDYDLNSEKDVIEVFWEIRTIRNAGHAVLVLHNDVEGLYFVKCYADEFYFMEKDKEKDKECFLLHAEKLKHVGKKRLRLCITADGLTFGS